MGVICIVSKDESTHQNTKGHAMVYMNDGLPSYIEVDTQTQGTILHAKGITLDDVYGRYSLAKAAAYARCMELCDEMDGCHLCITSATTCFFSAQFEFDNPMNGRPMVCHITPSRTYAMYTDMRCISTAHHMWAYYARNMGYLSLRGWNDADYDGCSIRWLCGTAYVYVDDEVYRVDNPFTKDGKLRVRPTMVMAGV